MSCNLPRVYDAIGFDWRAAFEPDVVSRRNGLVLRGAWGEGFTPIDPMALR
jgi:hypothetical protein